MFLTTKYETAKVLKLKCPKRMLWYESTTKKLTRYNRSKKAIIDEENMIG